MIPGHDWCTVVEEEEEGEAGVSDSTALKWANAHVAPYIQYDLAGPSKYTALMSNAWAKVVAKKN